MLRGPYLVIWLHGISAQVGYLMQNFVYIYIYIYIYCENERIWKNTRSSQKMVFSIELFTNVKSFLKHHHDV